MESVTLYTNARVHTFAEASTGSGPVVDAFAVSGGRFVAAGPEDSIRERIPHSAGTVDLGGSTVVPGFIDAHVHLIDYGLMLQSTADLAGCRSLAEVQERLRSHAALRPEGWLLGHGFDQELFPTHAFPTRSDLDQVSRDRPVIISRICGHAVVGNSAALAQASGPLPPGASETGLLTEDDSSLITARRPDPSDAQIDEAILTAGSLAASLGITGVHCLLADLRQLERLQAMERQGRLPVRFHAQIPYRYLDECVRRELRTGQGTDWLSIGALKIFSDGSMGARTAAMNAPYSDDPDNAGLLLIERKELGEMIRKAQANGFQCAIHAIGDRAVDTAVQAIADASEATSGSNPLRHRIEHASQMTPGALKTMVELAIPAAVQPQFVLTDFWTPQRVGEARSRWSYPFRTMLEAGAHLAMSSDCYVERLDPYELIYRAWVRDDTSKAESLDVSQTIRAYTRGSAYAAGHEGSRGAIAEGFDADAVIFDEPLMEMDPTSILSVRPRHVLSGGRLLAR